MAYTKLFGKDLSQYEDIDLDSLLLQLSDTDLLSLGEELIDPDDSMIPPAQRCRYHVDKVSTGPLNRKGLLDFLETSALEEKDWDEVKPYSKETRGRIWKPKDIEKAILHDDDDTLETEWDEILAKATEEELVDLAAVLGFHGMLNQVQYHEAFIEKKEIKGGGGESGFRGIAKHQTFRIVADDGFNMAEVETSLQQVKVNDPKLKELNLNNIKTISLHQLAEFADALKTNTHLEKLHLANTRATDRIAKAFAVSLQVNKTLLVLNLESNYIRGEALIALLDGIGENQTLLELRMANQRQHVLGYRVENEIADLLEDNYKLLNFGLFFEVPSARVRVQQCMQRNNDIVRKRRRGIEDEPVIVRRERSQQSALPKPRYEPPKPAFLSSDDSSSDSSSESD